MERTRQGTGRKWKADKYEDRVREWYVAEEYLLMVMMQQMPPQL